MSDLTYVPHNAVMDALRFFLVLSSVVLSVVYLRYVGAPSSPWRTAVKTLTIGLLAPVPLLSMVVRDDVFALVGLAAALGLSALGDFFLALKDQERFFLRGLGAFLAAHVAYVVVFVPRAAMPEGFTLVLIVAVLTASAAFVARLAPRLGKLKFPVLAYFAVIMAMVAAALSLRGAPEIVGAGAVLFAVSNSLIAVRKFVRPFPRIDVAVWITYCLAQYLIVAGLLIPPVVS